MLISLVPKRLYLPPAECVSKLLQFELVSVEALLLLLRGALGGFTRVVVVDNGQTAENGRPQ